MDLSVTLSFLGIIVFGIIFYIMTLQNESSPKFVEEQIKNARLELAKNGEFQTTYLPEDFQLLISGFNMLGNVQTETLDKVIKVTITRKKKNDAKRINIPPNVLSA